MHLRKELRLTQTEDVRKRVQKLGVYGLITFDPQGGVQRYSWVDENYKLNGISFTEYFVWLGWKYVEGAGFYDKHGNLAEAYHNGIFVSYPKW